MATYTLDDIVAAADKKYAHTTFTLPDGEVVLVNALRLSKEKRKALTDIQKRSEVEDDDENESGDEDSFFRETLAVVAQTEAQADLLFSHIGDDLGKLATVFKMYSAGTELGEASASQD